MYELDVEYRELSGELVKAAFEVHKTLGPGYLEKVYEDALVIELKLRNINFSRQKQIEIRYKTYPIAKGKIDLLIDNKIIVEIKAVECFAEIHRAQIISYLRATNLKLGLLMNFNVKYMKDGIRRVISTKIKTASSAALR